MTSNIASPTTPSPTISRYDRVKAAISLYSEGVHAAKSRSFTEFWKDLIFVVIVPIVASIIAFFVAQAAALFTTLGLGVVNAVEKTTRGNTMLLKYFSESENLDLSVLILNREITLCDPSDNACLDKITALLKQYMDKLYVWNGKPESDAQ